MAQIAMATKEKVFIVIVHLKVTSVNASMIVFIKKDKLKKNASTTMVTTVKDSMLMEKLIGVKTLLVLFTI